MSDLNDGFLSHLDQTEPRAELSGVIIEEIRRIRRRSLIFHRIISLAAISLSLSGLAVGLELMIRGFQNSGFGQYLSLILTDGRLLLSYWNEYLLSLLESLPISGLAGFLLSLSVFLAVLKYSANYLINGSYRLARAA